MYLEPALPHYPGLRLSNWAATQWADDGGRYRFVDRSGRPSRTDRRAIRPPKARHITCAENRDYGTNHGAAAELG